MEATWRTAWIILLRFDSIKWNIMWFLEWIFVLNLAEISIFILNHRSPLSIDSDTCLATFLLPIYGIIFETAAGSKWIQEYAYVLAQPRILFVSSHMEHDLNASMNNNFAYVFHWGKLSLWFLRVYLVCVKWRQWFFIGVFIKHCPFINNIIK